MAATRKRRTKAQIQFGITAHLRILGGKPVIRGTQVPVFAVLEGLAAGDSIAEVCNAHNLSLGQFQSALGYAARILEGKRVAVPSA